MLAPEGREVSSSVSLSVLPSLSPSFRFFSLPPSLFPSFRISFLPSLCFFSRPSVSPSVSPSFRPSVSFPVPELFVRPSLGLCLAFAHSRNSHVISLLCVFREV